jgi:preprotein translocase subunit SecE
VNRETKRTMQRQAPLEADPAPPVASARRTGESTAERRTPPAPRSTPMQFLREVRDELRQVAWPSRAEMVNYSTVVLFTLVLMVLLIFGLNFVFGKAVLFMFQK